MKGLIKNKDIIIILFSILVIISSIFLKKTNNKKENLILRQFDLKNNYENIAKPSFNYNKMLILLTKYRNIEKNFYSDYQDFLKNPKNLERTEKILEELKYEKATFKNYLKTIKAPYKRTSSNRKKNALRYYFKTLENAILDLEYMIEQVNLKVFCSEPRALKRFHKRSKY